MFEELPVRRVLDKDIDRSVAVADISSFGSFFAGVRRNPLPGRISWKFPPVFPLSHKDLETPELEPTGFIRHTEIS